MAGHGHSGDPELDAARRLPGDDPVEAGGIVRRCRRCRQRLDGLPGHVCPGCGEGFDLQDPRTFRVDRLEQVLLMHGNAGKVRMAELSLLRSGIAALVQEDYNAAGGPTAHLWVARDDVDAAMDALAAPPASGSPWTCECGEPHEGQFAECWSCGAERRPAGVGPRPPTPPPASRRTGVAAPVERTAAVPDVAELVEWYAAFLGLVPVASARTSSGDVRFEHDGTTLRVAAWDDDEPEDAGADDPRPVFILAVDSIDAAMDRLIAAGAAFVDPRPMPVPGGRSALFIDPFGVVHEVRDELPGG